MQSSASPQTLLRHAQGGTARTLAQHLHEGPRSHSLTESTTTPLHLSTETPKLVNTPELIHFACTPECSASQKPGALDLPCSPQPSGRLIAYKRGDKTLWGMQAVCRKGLFC